jgi:predicted DCC family thiol-disulfide oxidoreductase YuxK
LAGSEIHSDTGDKPVILYDGDCGFCSRIVIFVAERNPAAHFRFAPLQSPVGIQTLRSAGLPADDLATVVLLDAGVVYTKSTAALRITGGLRKPWPLARVFLLIPRPIRDFVYDVIARNRRRILPAQDRCMLPSQLEGRMVETDR